MHRSFLLLLSLVTLGFGIAAQASTITAGVYNLDGAYVAGHSVTGTVNLNSFGNVTTANLTFNDPYFDNPGLPNFRSVVWTNTYNGLSQNYLVSPTGAGQLALHFNTTANVNGYFDLCIGIAQCGTSVGTIAPSTLQIYGFYNNATGVNFGLPNTNFSSGRLVSTDASAALASTPEPSSLWLFGTGLIAIAVVGRFFQPTLRVRNVPQPETQSR
jgi:hypothetical protein